MPHLLVTNDFPPKVGGIQSYLWELWRRLPPDEVTVLTTRCPGARSWDRDQSFVVKRMDSQVLLPRRKVVDRIRQVAAEVGAGLVVLDPALPLGLVGPRLGIPYVLVLHGAEVTVPARLPVTRQVLRRVLGSAAGLIAAGGYPALQVERIAGGEHRLPPMTIVSPGVDTERFRVLSPSERLRTRARLGLPETGELILSLSRLVPRKGMDVLIDAVAALAPLHSGLNLVIAGSGRDHRRLAARIRSTGAPARLMGRVDETALADIYGCADVFAMICRDRWGGLEQEGFGIVFLEAAACGVPQVAGLSGGSAEAVVDGRTGTILNNPKNVNSVFAALARLLDNGELRAAQGNAARVRAEQEFSYPHLASRLHAALRDAGG